MCIRDRVGRVEISGRLLAHGYEMICSQESALYVIDYHAIPREPFKIRVQHDHWQRKIPKRNKVLSLHFRCEQDHPGGA